MLRVILFLFLLSTLVGCASSEKKAETPEGLFAIAQEFETSERYELAVLRYTDVKNKFPYSSYATKAELAIADVHYKAESWPEAQVTYQSFRELHPTHPQIPYVVYRIGMSFYNQVPESIDRDLTLAKDGIKNFDDVIIHHSSSEFVGDAKVKRDDLLKRLAGKEQYIGDFYYRHEMFDSALPRYDGLLKTYPNLGFDSHALSRASICAAKLSQKAKARDYYSVLKERFPGTPDEVAANHEVNR